MNATTTAQDQGTASTADDSLRTARVAVTAFLVMIALIAALVTVLAVSGHTGPRLGSCGAGQVKVGSAGGAAECDPGQWVIANEQERSA